MIALLLAVIALRVHVGFALLIKDVEVSITNDFSISPADFLVVRCQSGTDDTGFHTLAVGETFSFSFLTVTFIKRVLFFCSFYWPDQKYLHHFDIYKQQRDSCTSCMWKIRKDGPWDYTDKNAFKCYPWNPQNMDMSASNITSKL
ncbi:hypothetical protein Fmac_026343 [Flemingia macrophylla]|uniref:S-protein homolog n=1 Tax=Flemingia macrophylla TaxID=520843 RepID=A0ABD1LEL2_9FABA